MKNIIIPNTDFKCSKFIFGTGSLLHILNSKKRIKILEDAVDKGFTHFDTSPYYGYGLAEKTLGNFLKNNPDITVTTKVALYPPLNKFNDHILEMLFRKTFGKLIPSLSNPIIDFTIIKANQSLEKSLKRLGRDCIDILFIHEPIVELINIDEWKNWLEKLVKDGKIRYYGLSSLNSDRLEKFINKETKLFNILQVRDSIDLNEADFITKNNLQLQITYGYMSSLKKRHPNKTFSEISSKILKRNPNGAIVVSTTSHKNLNEIANLSDIND
jgi:D-threo-aldose 1-dehydrogenase